MVVFGSLQTGELEDRRMSKRSALTANKRRRLITYAWVTGLALITILLIYKEQTALLYILATLGVTALLLIVAVADLGGDKELPAGSATAGPAPVEAGSTAGSPRSRSSASRRR
jgi:hypothetical protein